MSGPKLTAMIIFAPLAFLSAIMFTIGLNTGFGAVMTGVIVAALTSVFIYFARSGKQGFARGFLALGAIFIVVPVAALSGFGDRVADGSLTMVQTGQPLPEDEASALIVSSIVASAGLVFGMIVGLFLVLIGGLMHRAPRPPQIPPKTSV